MFLTHKVVVVVVVMMMMMMMMMMMIQFDDKSDCVDAAMDFRVGSYAFHKKNVRIILFKLSRF